MCVFVRVIELCVFVNARPTRATRTACDTESQSEEERKEEPVAERRKSSLTELGNMLTSLILPQKTLVQPSTHHKSTAVPLSASEAKRLAA